MDLHDGTPFWPRRDGILGVHAPLAASVSCDVVVVGAGITGSLIALELARRGMACRRARPTPRRRRQHVREHVAVAVRDRRAARRSRRRDRRRARPRWRTASAAAASTSSSAPPSAVGARAAGSDARRACSWRSADAMSSCSGVSTRPGPRPDSTSSSSTRDRPRGAVGPGRPRRDRVGRRGDRSTPTRLRHRALDRATDWGASIHDRTEVVDFEFTPSRRVRLRTDRGHTVTAKHVVIATGYEVETLLPDLPIALHTLVRPRHRADRRPPSALSRRACCSGTSTTRTSTGAPPTTDDCSWAARTRHTAIRCGDGGRRPSKTRALAARRPTPPPARRRRRGRATPGAARSPRRPTDSPTSAPTRRCPRCQFALGFGGNGITYSALAAEYIADSITGDGPATAPSSSGSNGRRSAPADSHRALTVELVFGRLKV